MKIVKLNSTAKPIIRPLVAKLAWQGAMDTKLSQATDFLQALGGASKIESINNRATRLRIALVDMTKTESDDEFKALGVLPSIPKNACC